MIAFFRSWNFFPESKSSSLIEPISHSKNHKGIRRLQGIHIISRCGFETFFLYLSQEIELARFVFAEIFFLFAGAALR
jgi:hypothetical protein